MRLVPAPGQTDGHQIVVVETDEGPVVLGGDVGYSFAEIGQADTPGKRLVLELAAPTYLAHAREPHVPRPNDYAYSSGMRAVTAASTLSWIDGTSCISVRKPDAVMTRIRARPARLHGRRARLARDEGDLSDEVAGAELVDDACPRGRRRPRPRRGR